jgi:hypothetical protein
MYIHTHKQQHRILKDDMASSYLPKQKQSKNKMMTSSSTKMPKIICFGIQSNSCHCRLRTIDRSDHAAALSLLLLLPTARAHDGSLCMSVGQHSMQQLYSVCTLRAVRMPALQYTLY